MASDSDRGPSSSLTRVQIARRKWVAIVVMVAIALVSAGLVYYFVVREAHHLDAAFEGDLGPVWPPESPADLATEMATTHALEEFRARANDATLPDAGPTFDDIPGLLVRDGASEGLYYIEAVFGGASFDDTLPMAVLIHGRGDRARIPGGPFWGLDAPLRVIVPQAPDPLGQGWEWLPVRVGSGLVDRLTTALVMRADHVARFLRTLTRELPTAGRPIVSGFSQGGMLTFALATHHSDVVQAAFPLSAWLPPAMVPSYRRDDLTYPRIRSMHGTEDTIIEPAPTQLVFEALDERGFDVEFVPIEGVEHRMSEEMNDRLHGWLQEALGIAIEVAIANGELDGGVPDDPCPELVLPDGGSGFDGVGFDGSVVDAALPDAGPFDAGPPPDGGWPDAGPPCPPSPTASDAGDPPDSGLAPAMDP